MTKQFYLNFEDPNLDSLLLKHIQYSILKWISKLRYVNYKRIDISFVTNDNLDIELAGESQQFKIALIKCSVSKDVVSDLLSNTSIRIIYNRVVDCLKLLWHKNSWDLKDFENLYTIIELEPYVTEYNYGDKFYFSPDRLLKAGFVCIIYPTHADYYLNVLNKKGELILRLLFLEGPSEPALFFSIFNKHFWKDNSCFVLTDLNGEISYNFHMVERGYQILYSPTESSLQECMDRVDAFNKNLSEAQRLELLRVPGKK